MKANLKEAFHKNKRKIFSMAIVLLTLVAISVLAMVLFSAFGIIYYDDGVHLSEEIFDDFMSSWYGWVILMLLQVLITGLLCFIPGASMAFIIFIQAFFKKSWQAFLIAYFGVVFTSIIMYLIGRAGGYKLCEKLLGKEDCKRASHLLNHNGAVYFPIMMMFPVFPDDALVMIAGTFKMSMKWFLPSIFICRGIGVAAIIFGLSFISFDKFTSPWHWIGFIAACIVLLVLVFYLAYKFNKFLEKRGAAKRARKENGENA